MNKEGDINQRYLRLALLFIVVYFGEPLLVRLTGGTSTIRLQLVLLLILGTLADLFPLTLLLGATTVTFLALIAWLYLQPWALIVYPLAEVGLVLTLCSVWVVMRAAWASRAEGVVDKG